MTKRESGGIGVNLGGWLIVEKWLTPSIFAGTEAEDEWSLAQTSEGRKRIRNHRSSFITEADFAWLRQHQVELLRLPVPYWAVIDAVDYESAQAELAWAMSMAEKYEMKVLLDLHAAPGGQNVGDHSGRKGEMNWFDDSRYQTQTLDILKKLAHTYRDSPALWGIELLNEPEARGHWWQLVQFYRRAYRELRGIVRPGTYVVFHDGFQPLLFTGSLWARKHYPVAMDVHWYGFPLKRTRQFKTYLKYSGRLRKTMRMILQWWQPIIIGEWSSVLPQRFFDARPQHEHMQLLAANIDMQQHAYQPTLGTMYWNYKAEGEGMWNFRSLIEQGVIKDSEI